MHLRHARDAGLESEDAELVLAILRDFARLVRTRADEAHVAEEYVRELRQLIQRVLLDECSYMRLTWVVGDFVDWSCPV